MNRKVYRLCLVMVIVMAALSGIIYYQFVQKQEKIPEKGTFVWQDFEDESEVEA